MSLPEDPIVPIDQTSPTAEELAAQRARRRRATRRSSIPADLEGQSALITSLARRAYPSVELFIFSLLSGAIMALGFLLDSQAVILLGILLTPLMTPWVGFLLSIFTGSGRFFFEALMAMVISIVFVFVAGLLAGFAARLFLPMTLTNVFLNARLWIPALVVLTIGAVTLVASFVRSEDKPFLPSVLVAYAFFLPVNAAGFGLGSGLPELWPNGILVFLAHFALASVVGLITLFVMRLRPTSAGLLFSGFILLAFGGIMLWLMGPSSSSVREAVDTATPAITSPLPSTTPSLTLTPTNSPQPQNTPTSATINQTATVGAALTQAALISESTPVTGTVTVEEDTATPTESATEATVDATSTPEAVTVVVGKVSANEGGGANLRQTPNGKYIMTLDNGTLLEVLPDFRQVNGATWIHVYVTRNGERFEGWLLESVVIYATPAPNFEPSVTPLP